MSFLYGSQEDWNLFVNFLFMIRMHNFSSKYSMILGFKKSINSFLHALWPIIWSLDKDFMQNYTYIQITLPNHYAKVCGTDPEIIEVVRMYKFSGGYLLFTNLILCLKIFGLAVGHHLWLFMLLTLPPSILLPPS